MDLPENRPRGTCWASPTAAVVVLRALMQTPADSRAVAAPLSDALSGKGTASSTKGSSALTFSVAVVMHPIAMRQQLEKVSAPTCCT